MKLSELHRAGFARMSVMTATALMIWTQGMAASPGLPFTENFNNTHLRDDALTDADWNTASGTLRLGQTAVLDNLGTTESGLGTDTGDDALNSRAVTIGDVDRDGDVDIIVGNQGSQDLIYFNDNGFAAAGVPVSDDTDQTRANLLVDLDNDGVLVYVNSGFVEEVRFYRGRGNGSFEAAVAIQSATRTWDIDAEDLDADGDVDLVVSGVEARTMVLRNELTQTGTCLLYTSDAADDLA